MTRGAMAWLAVLLLICGIGVARFGVGVLAHFGDDDSRIVALNDTPNDDGGLLNLLDDDGQDDDASLHAAAAVVFSRPVSNPIPAEGQVAFALRAGALNRAAKPTGPPADVTA